MPRKNKKVQVEKIQNVIKSHFKLEFLNSAQKLAYEQFDKQDVLFLLGAAGTGKSHLACAFAISEVLAKRKKKIILTRPIVEAGESLGFLPGSFEEKVAPYMMPMYDCIERCVGREGPQRDIINKAIEIPTNAATEVMASLRWCHASAAKEELFVCLLRFITRRNEYSFHMRIAPKT